MSNETWPWSKNLFKASNARLVRHNCFCCSQQSTCHIAQTWCHQFILCLLPASGHTANGCRGTRHTRQKKEEKDSDTQKFLCRGCVASQMPDDNLSLRKHYRLKMLILQSRQLVIRLWQWTFDCYVSVGSKLGQICVVWFWYHCQDSWELGTLLLCK